MLLLGGCSDRPAGEPDVATLERQVRAFFEGMGAEDADQNRRAMAAIAPVAEDFEALVPGKGAALWAVWGPETRRLVESAPGPSAEYREVLPIRGVRIVDMRADASVVLTRALELLPKDLPVLGVVIEVSPGERAASAFVPVRGRWVWLWNLERLGSIAAGKR